MEHKSTLTPDPEIRRLELLRDHAILDTAGEPAFDRIAAEAARLLGAPMAAVTFVSEDRCWFKARHGLLVNEVPRHQSLCGYAFRSSGTFVVSDTLADARFKALPLVTESGVRFYIGVPLTIPEGHSLGTLCVLDQVPRQPTAIQIECLQALPTKWSPSL